MEVEYLSVLGHVCAIKEFYNREKNCSNFPCNPLYILIFLMKKVKEMN